MLKTLKKRSREQLHWRSAKQDTRPEPTNLPSTYTQAQQVSCLLNPPEAILLVIHHLKKNLSTKMPRSQIREKLATTFSSLFFWPPSNLAQFGRKSALEYRIFWLRGTTCLRHVKDRFLPKLGKKVNCIIWRRSRKGAVRRSLIHPPSSLKPFDGSCWLVNRLAT